MTSPTPSDPTLLTVVARMTALPGKELDLREALENLIPTTRAENGCVNYDLYVAEDDPATFVFYENWTGGDALDAHLANDHLVEFAGRLDEFLVGGASGLVITRLKRVA